MNFVVNSELTKRSGKNFHVGEVVNEIIGIPTLKSATSWNILENYVDGISDTHDVLNLGEYHDY